MIEAAVTVVQLKFDPGFRVIGEYLCQIDSTMRVNSNLIDS